MKRTAVAGCIALAALATATAAQAQMTPRGERFYIGLSAGQGKADVPEGANPPVAGALASTSSKEDSDTAFKVFFGYRMLPNLAFEAGITDFGTYTNKRTVTSSSIASGTGDFKSEVSVAGVHLDALGILPLAGNTDVFGKIGLVATSVKNKLSTTSPAFRAVSPDDTGSANLKLGVGAEWRIARVGLRVEYEQIFNVGDSRVTGGKFDIRMVSAGLTVRF
jgi:opacity protein-like surface antigen